MELFVLSPSSNDISKLNDISEIASWMMSSIQFETTHDFFEVAPKVITQIRWVNCWGTVNTMYIREKDPV